MEYCKTCFNYREDYDEHRQMYGDTEDKTVHYCIMYKKGIPDDISNNKAKCPYYIPKEISND